MPAVIAGFLLGAGSMSHAVVSSLLIFCGLHPGASSYGYLAWAQTAGWATIGNLVGAWRWSPCFACCRRPTKCGATANNHRRAPLGHEPIREGFNVKPADSGVRAARRVGRPRALSAIPRSRAHAPICGTALTARR